MEGGRRLSVVGPRSAWIGRPALGLLLVVVGLAVASPAEGQGAQPVAARDLPRGVVLEPADIEYPDGDSTGQDGPGPGWTTRRVIARGEVLREPAVGRPQLVRAGEEVDVVWRGGAIQLRLRGTAMGAATVGERVTVRIDTRRRIDGIAVGPGLIQILGDSK